MNLLPTVILAFLVHRYNSRCVVLCLLLLGQSVAVGESSVRLVHSISNAKDVELKGELGARYQAATCNLLTRTDRYTLDSFAANAAGTKGALWYDWPGDQFGRWYSVLRVAEGYGWPEAAWHREQVAGIILAHQQPEGHFGLAGTAESRDIRIPSGNAFALAGLMDAYRDTGDKRYLEAARRNARYFEQIAPLWEHKGPDASLHEFYGHCLDGLVALAEEGNDKQSLELAKRLALSAGRAKHTHHALSMCRGLIDLAVATGDPVYLDRARDYVQWCRDNQLITGGVPENMPASDQDEGCGLADWIVTNLKMFACTGEDDYLENAEHVLVNHFFMNQFHTGGFGHLGYDQQIVGGKSWQGWNGKFGSENPGCCSLWGQWALGETGRWIVTQNSDTVYVNLYADAVVRVPDREATLWIKSDFPRLRSATITVQCDEPQEFAVALRVPTWARSVTLQLDGKVVETAAENGRIVLRQKWPHKSVLSLTFDSPTRVVKWPASKSAGIAVFEGPLCLGLCSENGDLNLPWQVVLNEQGAPALNEQGMPLVENPSTGVRAPLKPIGAEWLVPDTHEPRRFRVLFDGSLRYH